MGEICIGLDQILIMLTVVGAIVIGALVVLRVLDWRQSAEKDREDAQ